MSTVRNVFASLPGKCYEEKPDVKTTWSILTRLPEKYRVGKVNLKIIHRASAYIYRGSVVRKKRMSKLRGAS